MHLSLDDKLELLVLLLRRREITDETAIALARYGNDADFEILQETYSH